MRNTIITSLMLAVAGFTLGCQVNEPQTKHVNATLANASTHKLNGVELECSGRTLTAGILSPGIDSTILDAPWPSSLPAEGKVNFIDFQTHKPYSITVSLAAVNAQVQAGTCHHVTIRILDYDKAEAVCE